MQQQRPHNRRTAKATQGHTGQGWDITVVLEDGFDFSITCDALYQIPEAIQTYKHTKLEVLHQNMAIATILAKAS
jgi:hypothetical protein